MVDTYGLLTPIDLLHYYEILDKNVKPHIGIGFHAHNNMQLAYANALTFVQKKTERNIIVDGTLYGMGKSAGNDPIELVANYLNEHFGKNYDIDQMLEAIEESVIDIYHAYPWDYKTFFYLSAKNKCHPNYVSYLQAKSNLSVSDLDRLLSSIEPEENKLLYKKEIAMKLYDGYKTETCDDSCSLAKLGQFLNNRKVLVIGPGKNILYLCCDAADEFFHKLKRNILHLGGHGIGGVDCADDDRPLEGSLAVADTGRLEVRYHGEVLPYLAGKARICELLAEDGVCLAYRLQAVSGDGTRAAHAESRAREGLTEYHVVGKAELFADNAYLILEQDLHRLHKLELHVLRKSARIVMRLDAFFAL